MDLRKWMLFCGWILEFIEKSVCMYESVSIESTGLVVVPEGVQKVPEGILEVRPSRRIRLLLLCVTLRKKSLHRLN